MTKYFLEIIAEVSEDWINRGIPVPMIRIEVKDCNDAKAKLEQYRGLFEHYVAYCHECHHDDNPPGPCRLIELERR